MTEAERQYKELMEMVKEEYGNDIEISNIEKMEKKENGRARNKRNNSTIHR